MMAAVGRAHGARARRTTGGSRSASHRDERDPAYTVAHSLCVAARELGLNALIVPTLSGRSARLVSAHRPDVPIYALSPGRETVRRCGLMWGVEAAPHAAASRSPRSSILESVRRCVELGWVKQGRARRDHGRAAQRAPGHDEPDPDPGGLTGRRRYAAARPA